MNRLLRSALAACALIAAAPAGSDSDPASYRLRVAIQPASGAKAQRLAIPGDVMVAAQTSDLTDLRVFDARGRAMPIARGTSAAPAPRRDLLPVLPILGTADALKVTGVSLRLDDQGRARVASVDGSLADRTGATVLGILLDARAVTGTVESLTLDADLPVAQPVIFKVEASRNLKDWRPIAEQTVYRAAPGRSGALLSLDQAAVRRDYLRVTWRGETRLLSPVTVANAALVTRSVGGGALVEITATVPRLANGKTIDLLVPFATPIARLWIAPAGDDLVVPVRILGRQNREQPWTVLGTGNAARVGGNGARGIPLAGATFRQLRIEADARTAGFSTPPDIRFGFAPREIVFLAGGQAPFTLAAGRSTAADPYLPIATLSDEPAALPLAGLGPRPALTVMLELAGEQGASRRTLILWAILIAATVLLGAMAWVLWRRTVVSGTA